MNVQILNITKENKAEVTLLTEKKFINMEMCKWLVTNISREMYKLREKQTI